MNGSFFKRAKASVIILGIALLLLGIAFFVAPGDAVLFVTYWCGWAFLFAGIATCVGYFRTSEDERSGLDLALAILEAVLGVLILIWPAWFALYLLIMLGCVVFITGIADIADAFALRKTPDSGWVLWLILGILTVFLGCLVFVSPFLMAEVAVIVAGVTLVFDGITEIVVGIRM